ncbi:unnamed protein product [Lactuca virosa]|uniref:Uncharacterized protein n=1 Tax=Lactuca virosa TaxID=75947 RepID=A0AAU9NTN0_9ASTR|nr:unnamed protein product [Lactuca virosa]
MSIKIDCLIVLGEQQSDNEKNIDEGDGGKPMLSVVNAMEQEESDAVSGGPLSCGQCVGNRER